MRNLLYLFFFLMVWSNAVPAVMLGFQVRQFTLVDSYGNIINLSDFRGKYVVLEWFDPDCVRVQQHYEQDTMRQLALNYMGMDVVWLAINSTYYMDQEDNIRWQDIYYLPYRLLGDFSGDVAKRYDVETIPQMYLIDPYGTLIYKGAFESEYGGYNAKPFNYVQAALEESLAGLPVSIPKTTPSGCYVKYPYY